MKTLVLLLSLIFAGATASADQWKTVTIKHNINNYEYEIHYPKFFSNSVPAYKAITASIKQTLDDNSCDLESIQLAKGGYYSAVVTVVALNKTYIGVRVSEDSYCGGAHPNGGSYYLTYNSKTGEVVKVEMEFGFQDISKADFDFNLDDAQRKKVAEILVANIPADLVGADNCFPVAKDAQIEALLTQYPMVAGLAKDKKIVLATSPAHVAQACQFDVRVSYDQVKDLIIPGSYLHKWLQKAGVSVPAKK